MAIKLNPDGTVEASTAEEIHRYMGPHEKEQA
jgi:hypothetical protein